MISRGRISVTGAVDLANCMLEDGMVNRAVDSFASLGANNRHPSNGERDFHRWLRDLFGFRLQTYHGLDGLTRHSAVVGHGSKAKTCPHKNSIKFMFLIKVAYTKWFVRMV